MDTDGQHTLNLYIYLDINRDIEIKTQCQWSIHFSSQFISKSNSPCWRVTLGEHCACLKTSSWHGYCAKILGREFPNFSADHWWCHGVPTPAPELPASSCPGWWNSVGTLPCWRAHGSHHWPWLSRIFLIVGAPSKMECVFFPPPQFFNDPHSSDPTITADIDGPWLLFDNTTPTTHKPPPTHMGTHTTITNTVLSSPPQPTEKWKRKNKKETQAKARQKETDVKYDLLTETQKNYIADGFETFCRTFKYLGSRISYNFRDDADIEVRLAAANQSMGALNEVWKNPHLDTYSKYLLFRAIPMNLLLWGCEN